MTRPHLQEIGKVLDTAPLTVYKIRTAKGRDAFKFESRSKKYADPSDMKRIAGKLWKMAYPDHREKKNKRQRKHYWMHRHEINIQRKKQRDALRLSKV